MEKALFTDAAARYQDMVYRIALHALGHPQDAEDTVQEVFLRLYTEKKPFEGEEHLRYWLIRVTVNACRDVLRSPWRKRRAALTEADLPAFQDPEEAELYQAVMGLPEKYRTVLDLFYYEELSVREIAGLLGVRESAVTTRLYRARAKLKEQLTGVWME